MKVNMVKVKFSNRKFFSKPFECQRFVFSSQTHTQPSPFFIILRIVKLISYETAESSLFNDGQDLNIELIKRAIALFEV